MRHVVVNGKCYCLVLLELLVLLILLKYLHFSFHLLQHLAILGCTHEEETEGVIVIVWLAVIVGRL